MQLKTYFVIFLVQTLTNSTEFYAFDNHTFLIKADLMGFRQFTIYDFLKIALFVIFVLTFFTILSYCIWNVIGMGINAFKRSLKKKEEYAFGKTEELISTLELTTIKNGDSVSLETFYESAGEEEEKECYI